MYHSLFWYPPLMLTAPKPKPFYVSTHYLVPGMGEMKGTGFAERRNRAKVPTVLCIYLNIIFLVAVKSSAELII